MNLEEHIHYRAIIATPNECEIQAPQIRVNNSRLAIYRTPLSSAPLEG